MLSVIVIAAVMGGTFYLVGKGLYTGRVSRQIEQMSMIAENQIERLKILTQTDPSGTFSGPEFCIIEVPSTTPGKPPKLLVRPNNDFIRTYPDLVDNEAEKSYRQNNPCYNIENFSIGTIKPLCRCDVVITKTPETDRDVFEVTVSWHSLRRNADSITVYHRIHQIANLNHKITVYPFYEEQASPKRVRLSFNDPNQAIATYEAHYKWDTGATLDCDSSIDTDLDRTAWSKTGASPAKIKRGAANYLSLTDFASQGELGWLCIRVTNKSTSAKGYRKLKINYHATKIKFQYKTNSNTTVQVTQPGVTGLEYFKQSGGSPPDCSPNTTVTTWTAVNTNQEISGLSPGDWFCVRGQNSAVPPQLKYSGLIYFGAIIDISQTNQNIEAAINLDNTTGILATSSAHPYSNVTNTPWAYAGATVTTKADCQNSSTIYQGQTDGRNATISANGFLNADNIGKFVCFRLEKPNSRGYIYGSHQITRTWVTAKISLYKSTACTPTGSGDNGVTCANGEMEASTGFNYKGWVAASFYDQSHTCTTSNQTLTTPTTNNPITTGEVKNNPAGGNQRLDDIKICIQYRINNDPRQRFEITCSRNDGFNNSPATSSWSSKVEIFTSQTQASC